MLAAGGLTSAVIAEQLVLSIRTVENHLQRAYDKLGVASRSELGAVLRPLEARHSSSPTRPTRPSV